MPVVLGLLVVWLARAEERRRVSLHDRNGGHIGYALADRVSGRVDFYDARGRRTDRERLTPACTVGRG